VDFGMVPLGFENLSIVVLMKNRGARPMRIKNIYLPVQEARLEYLPQLREPKVLNPGEECRLVDVFLSSNSIGPLN